jgi:hypothetical protein
VDIKEGRGFDCEDSFVDGVLLLGLFLFFRLQSQEQDSQEEEGGRRVEVSRW